ncbi:MAG: hypothetical protein V1873_09030 [Verrucomicrobiota bacterium]
MRARRLASVLWLAGAIALAAGCGGRPNEETGFTPSPSGDRVASHTGLTLDFKLSLGGFAIQRTTRVILRRPDGRILRRVPVYETRKGFASAGSAADMAWSPDGSLLGVRSPDELLVVDARSGRKRSLARDVAAFRWVSPSDIVFATGTEFSRSCAVCRLSLPDGAVERLFSDAQPHTFHPLTSRYHNPLSPDGARFVYFTTNEVRIVDVPKGRVAHRVAAVLYPSFCWWTDDSRRCLIHGLAEEATGKAFPENTAFADTFLLFDRQAGGITNMTANLRALNGERYNPPRPQVPGRVWSPDGSWFVATGASADRTARRDWICAVEPWRVLCVQEAAGAAFSDPVVANRGNRLALFVKNHDFDASGQLYVADVSCAGADAISLSAPRRIAAAPLTQWFWSADGTDVIVFDGGRFRPHPTGDQP